MSAFAFNNVDDSDVKDKNMTYQLAVKVDCNCFVTDFGYDTFNNFTRSCYHKERVTDDRCGTKTFNNIFFVKNNHTSVIIQVTVFRLNCHSFMIMNL